MKNDPNCRGIPAGSVFIAAVCLLALAACSEVSTPTGSRPIDSRTPVAVRTPNARPAAPVAGVAPAGTAPTTMATMTITLLKPVAPVHQGNMCYFWITENAGDDRAFASWTPANTTGSTLSMPAASGGSRAKSSAFGFCTPAPSVPKGAKSLSWLVTVKTAHAAASITVKVIP